MIGELWVKPETELLFIIAAQDQILLPGTYFKEIDRLKMPLLYTEETIDHQVFRRFTQTPNEFKIKTL